MRLIDSTEHRDDLHSLAREELRIDPLELPRTRIGRLDRPHIFQDGYGKILPASKLRSRNAVAGISGLSFKQGPIHSHDDEHQFHYLETGTRKNDLIKKFRREVKSLRRDKSDIDYSNE